MNETLALKIENCQLKLRLLESQFELVKTQHAQVSAELNILQEQAASAKSAEQEVGVEVVQGSTAAAS